MNGFEPVTLSWDGKDYVVQPNNMLLLIQRIEDALAGEDGRVAAAVLFRPGGVPQSRLAAAFGAALRYAGAKVTDQEVYLHIQEDMARGAQADVLMKTQNMIWGLISIISPPMARSATEAVEPEKKPSRAASSSRSTKSSSVKAG